MSPMACSGKTCLLCLHPVFSTSVCEFKCSGAVLNLGLMRMQNKDGSKQPSGIKHHLQDERTATQKRTFSRWMNIFLQRCDPPVKVNDLFIDIQDGRILMAILEELTGGKLVYRLRSSPHRMLKLSNVSKALAFLDERHVKLHDIDASGIVDGIPSVVLNLIWNIILHFQVKQVTAGLQKHLSPSRFSVSVSSYPSSGDLSPWLEDGHNYRSNTLPSKCRNAFKDPKRNRKAIKSLLLWVQRCTSKFGVEVNDFGKSWRSGLAFLALIKSISPTLVNLKESLSMEPRECLQQAFMIAYRHLDIPTLLDPKDMACISPDEQSIITYVSMFMRHFSIDKEPTSHIEDNIPQIPNFGSVESATFGGTVEPAARGLFECLTKSNEQELWERWAKKPSGSPRGNAPNKEASDTSTLSLCHGCNVAKCSPQEASQIIGTNVGLTLQPPSPLQAGGVSQEIRSWMEKGSEDRGRSKTQVGEGHLSMSSEEGIYNLATLDSEDDDDSCYMMDLSKDVFLPYARLRKGVAIVEEETAEEIILNGEKSDYLKVSDFVAASAHDVKSQVEGVVTGQNNDETVYGQGLESSHISKGGFFLPFSAPSCDISPLEVEMLLLLWILLYCCLIVPQMSL
ncbi:uncharacterized protein clmnb [Vanacampus margaritifer]